jgi:hypothetical protein
MIDNKIFIIFRCLVDSNFAHIKRLYKKSECNSLEDLRGIVDKSCYSNNAVLYAEEDSWVWCDWAQFFSENFLSVKGLRGYQIFRFHHESPGVVFCKKSSEADEIPVRILKSEILHFDRDARPRQITPGGLTQERQMYLHNRIRPFVSNPWKNVTCPPIHNEE